MSNKSYKNQEIAWGESLEPGLKMLCLAILDLIPNHWEFSEEKWH